MPNLMPGDILEDVRQVLLAASQGKGSTPAFLTAYQILDRLRADVRDRLIRERTLGGRGAGVAYAAPSVVSDAAEKLRTEGLEIAYIDTAGLTLTVAGQVSQPGYTICGLYRLRPEA